MSKPKPQWDGSGRWCLPEASTAQADEVTGWGLPGEILGPLIGTLGTQGPELALLRADAQEKGSGSPATLTS